MTEILKWNKVDLHNRVANAQALEQRLLDTGFSLVRQNGLSAMYTLHNGKGTPLCHIMVGLQRFFITPEPYQGGYDWLGAELRPSLISDWLRGGSLCGNNDLNSVDYIAGLAEQVVERAKLLRKGV